MDEDIYWQSCCVEDLGWLHGYICEKEGINKCSSSDCHYWFCDKHAKEKLKSIGDGKNKYKLYCKPCRQKFNK